MATGPIKLQSIDPQSLEPQSSESSAGETLSAERSEKAKDGELVSQPDGLTEFQAAVLAVLGATAPGDVLSYGDVAAEAGHPGAARAVGNALRKIGAHFDDATAAFPWWRVVTASGRLIPHDPEYQARLLKAEGIKLPLRPHPGG